MPYYRKFLRPTFILLKRQELAGILTWGKRINGLKLVEKERECVCACAGETDRETIFARACLCEVRESERGTHRFEEKYFYVKS